mmetsp:Transcript_15074/g.23322  ORF Transcript_15074/g.23322 Transcript_15074/m.23322 type:complete len:85 (-) Transcript_15074:268-522(-)
MQQGTFGSRLNTRTNAQQNKPPSLITPKVRGAAELDSQRKFFEKLSKDKGFGSLILKKDKSSNEKNDGKSIKLSKQNSETRQQS